MKNKLRKIVVNSERYQWRIKSIDPNYVCLKVWVDGKKQRPAIQVRYRFDNPWIYFGEIISAKVPLENIFQFNPVSPKMVARIIALLSSEISVENATINCEINEEGSLQKVSDALLPGKSPFLKN